jgi:ABC-type Fe3+-siderophore transport system permease subunit
MSNIFVNPKALGEISKDLGQIFFASVFISSLMSSDINYFTVIIGFILAILSWLAYIITRKY